MHATTLSLSLSTRFSQLVENFSSSADFVFVYIAEAHPAEQQHFGGNYDIATHRQLDERLEAANIFMKEVDPIMGKNEMRKLFASKNVFEAADDELLERSVEMEKEEEEEKVEVANEKQLETVVDVLVDLMEDEANRKYAAFPERLYGILDGKVGYVGDVGPSGYDIEELKAWLKKIN